MSMLNKYVECLIRSNAKVYRLQQYADENGYLSLGNLVRPLESENPNTSTLRVMAFRAVLDELNLPEYDVQEQIKYVRGQSELNQNDEFNDKYGRLCKYIDMLKVSKWFYNLCGVVFYLAIGSFALVYFSWWFLLLPPFLYSYANLARRNHVLRNSMSLSILYELSETFANYCRKKEFAMDFPDDPSFFSFIVEGQGTKNMQIRLGDNKWDSHLIAEIRQNISIQKEILTDIKIMFSVDAL